MKTTSAELKRSAREHLQGNYPVMIGATVVASVLPSLILFPFSLKSSPDTLSLNTIIYFIASFLISLIGTLLATGLLRMSLMLAKKEKPQFKDLFFCITNRPDQIIAETLLIALITLLIYLPSLIISFIGAFTLNIPLAIFGILLMLISMVPVVIFSLSANFAFLILAEDDSYTVIGALKESMRIMKGNVGRLFYISLSFLGWQLLNTLSLGIGSLWLTPYIYQTQIEFYLDITNPHDN